jgi:dihydropteroate synthase
MLNDGATILDIGGQSTKPGIDPISEAEEIKRAIPAIEAIAANFPKAFISVDTYFSSVAKMAVAAGASIMNDISGGMFDDKMITTVAKLNVPFVCMHTQGRPKTMQQNPIYQNVTTEILDYFINRNNICKQAGIKDIILDVGFGFGKTIAHNYQLLKDLNIFDMLDKPLLVGVSRKGMVYKPLGINADEALNGTTVLHTLAIERGANILRVHDVKEAIEAIKLVGLLVE